MKVPASKSVAAQILKALGMGLVVSIILSNPSGSGRLLKGIRKEWKKRGALTALERLRRRGFVDFFSQKDGSLKVVLTVRGKKEIRHYQMGEIEFTKRRWDGAWRVIMFDIPERKKNAREALRAYLRVWGFYPLQRSVYISRYPCEEEIAMLQELFNITDRQLVLFKTRFPPRLRELQQYFRVPQ